MRINGLNGLDAHVWVENIQTKASSTGTAGNVLRINAETNVSDDLEIWGNNDDVTFKNSYCGYNYNKDYSAANIGKTSDNAHLYAKYYTEWGEWICKETAKVLKERQS